VLQITDFFIFLLTHFVEERGGIGFGWYGILLGSIVSAALDSEEMHAAMTDVFEGKGDRKEARRTTSRRGRKGWGGY
jgi:hypothetical protein